MKLCGIVLIISVFGFIGCNLAAQYNYRVRELEDWQQALRWCEAEINYNLLPLAEVLEMVGGKISNAIGLMLCDCANGIKNECLSAQMSWQAALEKYLQAAPINADDAIILARFGINLGNSDLIQQNKNFAFTYDHLEQALNKAKHERQEKPKIYRYLGFSAGLALVLLLL